MDSKVELNPMRELLSPKELQCLYLVAQDNNTHEISQKLNRSLDTIKKYRAGVLQKLDCHTMAGAVMLGIKLKLFDMAIAVKIEN